MGECWMTSIIGVCRLGFVRKRKKKIGSVYRHYECLDT